LGKPEDRIVPVLKQHARKVRASGSKVPPALISHLEPGENSVWLGKGWGWGSTAILIVAAKKNKWTYLNSTPTV